MALTDEYAARLKRWEKQKQSDDRLFRTVGNLRLALALLTIVTLYFAGVRTVALPVTAFIALAAFGSRVQRRQTAAARALRYYERAIARCEDRWSGTGTTGEQFRRKDHLYADDLDLFGEGGLFQMVAQMRTAAGEATLADWLLAPASMSEARARQHAVRELRERLDLRETLALLGPDVQSGTHPAALEGWAVQAPVVFPAFLRPSLAIAGVAGVCCVLAFFAGSLPPSVLLAFAAVDIAIATIYRKRVRQVLESAEAAGHGLGVLALVLEAFERETFQSEKLVELRRKLEVKGTAASKRVHQLSRWVDWLDSSDHVLVRAFGPIIFFREQLAMALESWRRDSGSSMAEWLRAVGELEALCSLATLHYERPEWSFPQLSEERGWFVAGDLQHPLLPRRTSVANDVEIQAPLQVMIVSGSNMSGKSTLLRAIGLNTILAWAGGPVAARSLRLSHLHVGASIRVADSLQDNRSRFFAEIVRLRQIVEASATGTSVLFLLDELLSGTNSSDRKIGSEAIVKTFIRNDAIGFVTTHDLALAEIATATRETTTNVHFEDRMSSSGMDFDYKLKDGVVTHSNALALMRAVGLEV